MKKKSHKRTKSFYKMKGCDKKHKRKTSKNYLGGNDLNLAYTGNKIPTVPNPFLSYTGKGGNKLNPMPINTDGADKTVPNTGPNNTNVPATYILNASGSMRGGAAYPNGLLGDSWKGSTDGWPGVDGIQGNRNHLPLNEYKTDISRKMESIGAEYPFTGGKRRRNRRRNNKSKNNKTKNNKNNKTKKQKGGALSNLMTQDLINLGRNFQFSMNSSYNMMKGLPEPVDPTPWKGQLLNTPNLSTIRGSLI